MIPTIAAPHIQVAPPVDTSVFTAPSSDPAIGRLPLNIVPATVSNPKVADNTRHGQQHAARDDNATAHDDSPAFTLFGQAGEMVFASPYSTPFLAQLFGQFDSGEVKDTQDVLDFDRLADMDVIRYKPSMASRPRETVAELPEITAQEPPVSQPPAEPPSRATPVQDDSIQAMMQSWLEGEGAASIAIAQSAAPASQEREVVMPRARRLSTVPPSLLVGGVDAYDAIQSRNLLVLAGNTANTGISLTL